MHEYIVLTHREIAFLVEKLNSHDHATAISANTISHLEIISCKIRSQKRSLFHFFGNFDAK